MCSPLSILAVLATWLVLIAVFTGIGLLTRRAAGLCGAAAGDLFLAFWIGWAVTIAALQVLHLALPVDERALAAVVLAGAAGAWLERGALRSAVTRAAARPWLALAGVGLGLLVASQALAPLAYFDTPLYHLTTLDWFRAYPLVPGIGNLLGRLAYNSSFLLYAALLETGPVPSFRVANGLLLLVLIAQTAWRAADGLRHGSRLEGLVHLFLLGPIAAEVFGGSVSSLSTDLPAFALSLVIAGELLSLVAGSAPAGREGAWRLAGLALLAATDAAVKLSLIVYAGLTAALALALWWRQETDKARRLRTPVAAALVAAAVLGPWTVRSVVTSGYAVFPGGLLPFSVEWRVPRPLMLDETYRIYGKAHRITDHWAENLGRWDWLAPWWRDLPHHPKRLLLVAALALAVLLARRRAARWKAAGLVLLPALVALLGWFLSAPNPRFAAPLLAVVAAALGAFAVLAAERSTTGGAAEGGSAKEVAAPPWALGLIALAVFALTAGPPGEARNDEPTCEVPAIAYVSRRTDAGLDVHMPAAGLQCWRIPLPCTPFFRPNLRLRRPGDLGRGFVLDPTLTVVNAEGEGPVVPLGFETSADLGVDLVSGWRRLDLGRGRRVMRNAGRFLVYSERPARVRLRLDPSAIEVWGEPRGEAALRILHDGRAKCRDTLRPGREVVCELDLHRDFNDLVLAVAGETPPADGRKEAFDVTFASISLRSLGGL